jgi:hypothetical protein
VCLPWVPDAASVRHRQDGPARHLTVCEPPAPGTATVPEYGWAWLFEDLLGHPAGAPDAAVSPRTATAGRAG